MEDVKTVRYWQICTKHKLQLIQEGDLWSIQCLDFDIAAQGRTIDEAKDRFEKTFLGQIELDIKEKREPFSGVEKAPQEFWEMFEKTEPACNDPNCIYCYNRPEKPSTSGQAWNT